MKNSNVSIYQSAILFVIIIFALNITSCVPEERLVTEREDFTLDLPDFSMVTLDFPAKVIIYKGTEQAIKINAQPEIFDAMTKTVTNGEWLIDLANFRGGFESVTIEITIPFITGLHATSTGDISVQDYFEGTNLLDLRVESTGNIDYQGTVQQIDLLIDGTGNINLAGNTTILNARLSSTGDLSAYGLSTEEVDLVSTSTGDAEIRVEKMLTVTMTSTGDVKYKGNPQIISSISGTGDLKDEN